MSEADDTKKKVEPGRRLQHLGTRIAAGAKLELLPPVIGAPNCRA